MDNKENPIQEGDVAVAESATQEGEAKINPMDAGRERIAKAGAFFSKVAENTKSIAKSVSGRLSRFFSRAGKVAGTGAVAIAGAPEFIKQGADLAGKKIDSLADAGVQKIADAEQWVSDTKTQISEAVSEKAEQFGAAVGRTYAQAEEMGTNLVNAGVEKYHQFEDLCAAGAQNVEDFVEKSAKWVENKKEQAKTIAHDGLEVAKDVAFAVETKTIETFNAAKEGVKKQYDSAVEFGEQALVKAKVGWAETKKKFRNTLNAWRVARLNARIERDMQARDRLLGLEANTQLMSEVDQIEAAA